MVSNENDPSPEVIKAFMLNIFQLFRTLFDRLDELLVQFMTIHGVRYLRISLALVFIWFGLLKVVGHSPVATLVANTVYWVSPKFFVPFLGIWELIIGFGLLFSLMLRLTLFLFWLQLAGTFLVLVVQPDITFQAGNLLLLTTEGEFVIKNLVLIASGLVVGSTVKRLNGQRTNAS